MDPNNLTDPSTSSDGFTPTTSRSVDAASRSEPAALVLSEERLVVRTEIVERERVLVQKYVVTEEQTLTVTVRREEIRITRDLIVDRASRVPGCKRDDLVVILHEERPVVTMDIVPIERVTLATGSVTANQTLDTVLLREVSEIDHR